MLLGPLVRGCVVALGKEREPWTPWPLFCTGQGAMLETLMNNILHQLAMTLDPLEGWKMSPESGARDGSAPGDLDPSPGPAPNGRGSLCRRLTAFGPQVSHAQNRGDGRAQLASGLRVGRSLQGPAQYLAPGLGVRLRKWWIAYPAFRAAFYKGHQNLSLSLKSISVVRLKLFAVI